MITETVAEQRCKHRYLPPGEINIAGCGAFEGESAVGEALVFYTLPPEDYVPQSGDICVHCLQVCGSPEGVTDPTLKTIVDHHFALQNFDKS